MRLIPIDEKHEILVMPTVDEATTFAMIRFLAIAEQAIKSHGSFSVALSGGSTPKRLYEKLSLQANASRIDWSKVKLFWSDERVVSPDHPDSNYKMAMEYFSKEPLCQAEKFYMIDDENLQKAALNYENKIKQHCHGERFDLVLLGIGDDAHTASLFPRTEALHMSERLVVPNYVSQKKSWRMTLTFTCINDARKIIVLAFGKEKGKALQNSFMPDTDPDLYPAKRIGEGLSPALFVIDEPALEEMINI